MFSTHSAQTTKLKNPEDNTLTAPTKTKIIPFKKQALFESFSALKEKYQTI